ncbi:BamA/TamA family outer membrane protein [Mucilaginibacter sp. PAMB04168]|uniref:translocation and assembly module lipoprotein TamL n=1 Tax=Mucilaginibacter sp. PAMB04168 TaxID=3138567 RepID=UPI0031F62DCD
MIKNLAYFTLTSVILLSACSTTKDLPAGQKLYTGAEINFTDKDLPKKEKSFIKSDLQGLLRPKPNGKIGPFRFKLWVYQKTRTTKTKGLKHWLNTKFGEPPVLVSAVDLVQNSSILQNRLQNRSYFQAQVAGDTVGKEKVAKAVYTVSAGPSYKYRNIIWPSGTNPLDSAIAATAGETILKKGDQYNLDAIKAERLRIDARLKEKGFYYFAPENLIFSAFDTTVAGHQIDARIKIKDDVSDRARQVYKINKIYVYPNYSLRDTALKLDSALSYRWYNIIETRRRTVRPFVFKNTVLLHPGEVYNRTDHNNSLNRFVELGPFKFVKNRFEDVTTDSAKLNVFYFLTQYPRKTLSFDALVRTTSANYNGTQLNINWRHRNAFKGAEALTVTLFGSTDGQIAANNGGYALSQVGIQTTLSWPRFISPFNFSADNAYIPRTNFSLGYSIINRSQLYNLSSFNGSFGYQWKQSVHKQHELNLLMVTYVKPASVTELYRDSIRRTPNPALKHVIDPQFTFGPTYSYTYTNTTETYRTNTVYYNGRVSLSGNVLGIVSGADTLAGNAKKLFGTNYNQYVKLENEFRFFHKLGPKSTVAARVIASAGLPYGNSTILPYSQQFFIGGANSLRGFRARSIGPGTVDPLSANPNGFIGDQSGDIKLEANVEYRPHLFSIVYGALFFDAGNIWNAKSYATLPGGTFNKKFLTQLATDAGFGLRFDASILVLRTDFGFPLTRPYKSDTANDKMVFNLAIGYPF